MTRSVSLRARLTAIILLPLMCVATLAGIWQLSNARETAAQVFDRSLLSAALAVANDVAISGGDALSTRTRDLLADTSGGLVFYNVYAPDGVIVTGYASPPVGAPQHAAEDTGPTFFDGIYLGRTVSGVRLQNLAEVDGFSGVFTTTVWQDSDVRSNFVRQLVLRTAAILTGLVASLALIVWFGVQLGLRPLLDLENAIEQRSSAELSPIQRPVPQEVAGIVQTLNGLFDQVSRSMTAQADFLSNAAHQLRNPIAGVLSLAEAVTSARDPEETKRRADDLLSAARETADLSQKLLLMERASAATPASAKTSLALVAAVQDWQPGLAALVPEHVSLTFTLPETEIRFLGDATMLREALANMIDNSLRHGGGGLTEIRVQLEAKTEEFELSVADNGQGIPEQDLAAATERFRQLAPTSSSGLGLSIVEAVAQGHGGTLYLSNLSPGLRVSLRLPKDMAT